MNKITNWFVNNKLAASLIATLTLGTLILGYLSYQAWDEYGTASADYTSKAAQLLKFSQDKPFPSQDNLTKLDSTISTEQSQLDSLNKDLQRYRIPSFDNIATAKPQDRPQRFQDALRNEVTRIKALATSSGATLPPGFYLGLDEYENRLPLQDDVQLLAKQLTVLSWLGELLANHKDLIISEFSRPVVELGAKKELPKKTPLPAATKASTPYASSCAIKVSFRCNQGSFREIINSVSTASYFLIIDQLLVQNTSGEPPRRDTPPPVAPPTPDGTAPVQRLPIIVGRELLDISLKLSALEFADQTTAADSNLQTKPSNK